MAREVNISLRGFLEELPAEVAELLVVTLRKVGDVETQIEDVVARLETGKEVEHCLVDLDIVRQSLYKADNRLSDCINILTGYVQHKNGHLEAPPEPPSEVGTE